jgi:hypothetical protein
LKLQIKVTYITSIIISCINKTLFFFIFIDIKKKPLLLSLLPILSYNDGNDDGNYMSCIYSLNFRLGLGLGLGIGIEIGSEVKMTVVI